MLKAQVGSSLINPGAPKGNQNAFKHGLYGAEAVARRRAMSSMLRDMRALIDAAE